MGVILAIDPAFTATGWALFDGDGDPFLCGCIRTEPTPRKRGVRVADDDARRTQEIARALQSIIRAHKPSAAIVELPNAGAKGARPIACMARAAAIVATVLECERVPAEWVTPGEVKRVAGAKHASKDDVRDAVEDFLGLNDRVNDVMAWLVGHPQCETEHVYDAMAAFIAARHSALVRMACQACGGTETSGGDKA